MTLFAKVVEVLKAAGADDIVVFGGWRCPGRASAILGGDGRCASVYAWQG
jgi:methylmalonyl-CoA mutase cobalamin-binding subunit